MVDVGEYKEGTSDWLRGSDVLVGDVLTILDGGYLDDETFQDKRGKGKLYFCTNMRLERTKVEKMVRLGPENVKRIAEKFGDNTLAWINKQVAVQEVKLYKGLQQKGIIFRPVEGSGTTTPTAPTEQASLGTPRQEPVMTRGEALDRSKNWPQEDQRAWLKYLESHGKLKD